MLRFLLTVTHLTACPVRVCPIGDRGRNVTFTVQRLVLGRLKLMMVWNSVLGIRSSTLVLLLVNLLVLAVLWRLRPLRVARFPVMTLRSVLLSNRVMKVIL